jgi:alcohol dehydrogenase class IV
VTRIWRFGWGALNELPAVIAELELERLVLVTSKRGRAQAEGFAFAAVFDGVRPHVPVETVRAGTALVEDAGADGLVGLGGGSAIDTCKAIAASLLERDRRVRTIAVPTTYAGAECTPYFGMRDEHSRTKAGGAHELARPAAAIYDPALTIDLPREDSGGTAMNALAHCAEAFYAARRNERGDRHAHCGAAAIAHALPLVLVAGRNRYARTRLLEGAMRAAWALDEAGMALGHAMAQALGGRYGIPHGAANALCLPPALRFNAPVAEVALAKLAEAMGTADPIARVEELARLAGVERLRDLGVPEDELDLVAAQAAVRGPARANPRPASAPEIAELLRSIW